MVAAPLWSQEKQELSVEELAKKSQNPVEPMISVPFQNNINFGYGPRNNTQNILNIQPVIPIPLTKELNLITRTIAPVINQPWPEQRFGLGDINISLFLSPAKPNNIASGNFIWGAGPILQFPSATSDILGAGKWAAGPAAVGVFMKGPWVVGALANNLWSYGGDSNRPTVNQFLTQPFINYNLPQGWFLSTSPIITANWVAKPASDVWTVPLGGGVGKVFRIGKQSFSGSVSYYYNVAKPEVGPDWTLRLALSFLFPL
ncbi:MAG: neuromedin U [Syntrophus sp. (in: bacteria)]|nr:neuromedin U [Syntrophus sp. (in: bacteria)]